MKKVTIINSYANDPEPYLTPYRIAFTIAGGVGLVLFGLVVLT